MRGKLLIVVVLAAALRLVALDIVPPSLNWDEISHGWNAYSILKTGADEWGVKFPVIFRAFGDYKLPVYIYLTSLSEAVFGLTAFAVRLPSILAGVALVIFTYLLTRELFGKQKLAPILAALLVAVEPWNLFMSRSALEANVAVALITIGVYLFLRNRMVLSATAFGLSVWTYNSARVFVPLLVVLLVILYREEFMKLPKKMVGYSLVVLGIFFIPMFLQLSQITGQARYSEVAVLDKGAIGEIEAKRNESNYPPVLVRFLYNRPVKFAEEFTKNYFKHFSPGFLYKNGGTQHNYSVPNKGLLYWINAPFLLLGLVVLLYNSVRFNHGRLVLGWLFLAPVASSLTREAPHVLRAGVLIPTPMIISALGFCLFVDWIARKFQISNLKFQTIVVGYLIILFISTESYLTNYFGEYKSNYSWSWQYGYEQVVDYAKAGYDNYDKIIVTKKYGEPHIFFLFYWLWDPINFRNDPNLIRFNQSKWYWVDRFDKFYFVNDWQIPAEQGFGFVLESGEEFKCENERCLLITSPKNAPREWNKVKEIDFLDGSKAFEIYEN